MINSLCTPALTVCHSFFYIYSLLHCDALLCYNLGNTVQKQYLLFKVLRIAPGFLILWGSFDLVIGLTAFSGSVCDSAMVLVLLYEYYWMYQLVVASPQCLSCNKNYIHI